VIIGSYENDYILDKYLSSFRAQECPIRDEYRVVLKLENYLRRMLSKKDLVGRIKVVF
jgi:hypothetical protein